jgi:hypothetical protein
MSKNNKYYKFSMCVPLFVKVLWCTGKIIKDILGYAWQ